MYYKVQDSKQILWYLNMETDTKLFLLKRLDLSPHLILAHHIVKNIAIRTPFLHIFCTSEIPSPCFTGLKMD